MWKRETIEKVKSYIYLGYIFCENYSHDKHVITQVAKGNALMDKVLGIEQRLFINDRKRSLVLFTALVSSIVFNGVEIWSFI